MKVSIPSKITLNCLCIAALFSCATNYGNNDRTAHRFSFGVDYLYWKAQQEQMYYANAVPGGINLNDFIFDNQMINVDQKFKYDSGVRAELGYTFCSDWDSRLVGTHFKSCSFGAITIPNGVLVTGIAPFIQFEEDLIASTANSRWKIQFNTLDWEFGRFWDICEEFTMRSHIGLKWAKIKQSQFVNYPSFAGGAVTATMQKRNTFTAVGPRFGLNADWCFWNHFSLVGNIATSLLYGKFKINTISNISEVGTQVTSSFPACKKRLRPALEMLAGIDWKKDFSCFCDDDISCDIGIAYEAQYWWNQWQALTTVLQGLNSLTNNGDLMFHGLTVHFGLEF